MRTIQIQELGMCKKLGNTCARFWALYLNRYFSPKKYKNRGFGCFESNCFRKMRKSGYFYTKYLDFKNYLYEIRHYYVIYTKVINKTFFGY